MKEIQFKIIKFEENKSIGIRKLIQSSKEEGIFYSINLVKNCVIFVIFPKEYREKIKIICEKIQGLGKKALDISSIKIGKNKLDIKSGFNNISIDI